MANNSFTFIFRHLKTSDHGNDSDLIIKNWSATFKILMNRYNYFCKRKKIISNFIYLTANVTVWFGFSGMGCQGAT